MLAINGFWGRGVNFFLKECDFWYAAHAPEDSLAPMHILVALSLYGEFKKRIHGVGENCGERGLDGSSRRGGSVDLIKTHYTYI